MPSTSSCLIWASSALDCVTHNVISGPLSAFDLPHTFLFHQNMFTVNLPWRRNSSDCPGFPIGFQAAWVNYKFIVTKQCCHHHNNKIQKAITCTSQPFVGDQQVAPSSPRGGGASSETSHHHPLINQPHWYYHHHHPRIACGKLALQEAHCAQGTTICFVGTGNNETANSGFYCKHLSWFSYQGWLTCVLTLSVRQTRRRPLSGLSSPLQDTSSYWACR